MAPEIVQKLPYSGYSADIWAMGVILYSLLAGKLPFAHKNEKELFIRIKSGSFLPITMAKLDACQLVNKMLSVDPLKRPTASGICESSWLKEWDLQLGYIIKSTHIKN